jgi:argininosuccinate synthase
MKNPQNAPNTPARIDIVFNNGIPMRCSNPSTGNAYEQPLHILQFLNQIGGNEPFENNCHD